MAGSLGVTRARGGCYELEIVWVGTVARMLRVRDISSPRRSRCRLRLIALVVGGSVGCRRPLAVLCEPVVSQLIHAASLRFADAPKWARVQFEPVSAVGF